MSEQKKLTLKLKFSNVVAPSKKMEVVIKKAVSKKEEKQHTQKYLSYAEYKVMLQYIAKKYLHFFAFKKLLPIKVHLFLFDKEKTKYSKRKIRNFLSCYCNNKKYKNLLEKQAERLSLDGK